MVALAPVVGYRVMIVVNPGMLWKVTGARQSEMKKKQSRKRPAAEIIFSVEESPEGGFEAHALGHSIFTEADTVEELRAMVQDAVRCHFDDADRPRVIRLHWVKDEVLRA
jgi:hypothetical protein